MFVFSAGFILNFLIAEVLSGYESCSDKICQEKLGPHGLCSPDYLGNCTCDDITYLQGNSCLACPGIGESCAETQCCNAEYLVCHSSGICLCMYNEICLTISDEERARFQRVAQCILAVALVFTATILFFLFWKACTRRGIIHRHMREVSLGRFPSLNSIQRLVLMQLQDRPPPYSAEYIQPTKTTVSQHEITDPPPSYIEAIGGFHQNQGQDNLVFYVGENTSTTLSQECTSVNQNPSQQRTQHNSLRLLNGVSSDSPMNLHNSLLQNVPRIPLQNIQVPENSIMFCPKNAQSENITADLMQKPDSSGTSSCNQLQNPELTENKDLMQRGKNTSQNEDAAGNILLNEQNTMNTNSELHI